MTDKKARTVVVEGKLSGDCECWCLEVSEEEYQRIAGFDAWNMEKGFRESMREDFPKDRRGPWSGPWRLYPSDLIDASGPRVRLTIIAEDLEDKP